MSRTLSKKYSKDCKNDFVLREGVKYYFEDFVRTGGTPPPLRTKCLAKKELRTWGVPPLPFFTGFFQQKGGYRFGGYPPPLRTKSAK